MALLHYTSYIYSLSAEFHKSECLYFLWKKWRFHELIGYKSNGFQMIFHQVTLAGSWASISNHNVGDTCIFLGYIVHIGPSLAYSSHFHGAGTKQII